MKEGSTANGQEPVGSEQELLERKEERVGLWGNMAGQSANRELDPQKA